MPSVLITGATGYLGSNLSYYLSTKGYDVSIITRNVQGFSNPAGLDKKYILSTDSLYTEKPSKNFDIIIHCATIYKSDSALEIAEVNVGYPLRVANHYLKPNGFFLNIDTSLEPVTNLYSQTKNIIEQLFEKMTETEEFKVLNLELQYFFDENEPRGRFITSLIEACMNNKAFDLTKGDQVRDFIHIKDLMNAIRIILKHKHKIKNNFQNIEIGLGNGITIKNLTLLIKELTGSDSKLNFGAIPYRKNETMYAEADTAFLRNLGWKPDFDLRSALKITINKLI